MNKLVTIARYLMGVLFIVFGLNGFLNFIPMPPPPEAAGAFLGGLAGSGYFFPFLKVVEIATGVLLVANLYVPLALLILAPVVLNIVLYHLALDPAGGVVGYLLLVLGLFLAYGYRNYFREVLSKKTEPAA